MHDFNAYAVFHNVKVLLFKKKINPLFLNSFPISVHLLFSCYFNNTAVYKNIIIDNYVFLIISLEYFSRNVMDVSKGRCFWEVLLYSQIVIQKPIVICALLC